MVDCPPPKVTDPPDGETLVPAAEAYQFTGPDMSEPVLAMVNSNCPLTELHTPLTVRFEPSHVEAGRGAGAEVSVGVGLGS